MNACPDDGSDLQPLGILTDAKWVEKYPGTFHWYKCDGCTQRYWFSFTPSFAALWGRSIALRRWPEGLRG